MDWLFSRSWPVEVQKCIFSFILSNRELFFFLKKYQKTQKFQVHNFIIQFHRKSNKNCYAMISNNVIISSVQSDRRESLGKSGSVPGVAGDKGISDFSPKVFFQGNKVDVNLRAFVLYFSLPRLPSLLCASDSIMLLAPFIHLAFFFFQCLCESSPSAWSWECTSKPTKAGSGPHPHQVPQNAGCRQLTEKSVMVVEPKGL